MALNLSNRERMWITGIAASVLVASMLINPSLLLFQEPVALFIAKYVTANTAAIFMAKLAVNGLATFAFTRAVIAGSWVQMKEAYQFGANAWQGLKDTLTNRSVGEIISGLWNSFVNFVKNPLGRTLEPAAAEPAAAEPVAADEAAPAADEAAPAADEAAPAADEAAPAAEATPAADEATPAAAQAAPAADEATPAAAQATPAAAQATPAAEPATASGMATTSTPRRKPAAAAKPPAPVRRKPVARSLFAKPAAAAPVESDSSDSDSESESSYSSSSSSSSAASSRESSPAPAPSTGIPTPAFRRLVDVQRDSERRSPTPVVVTTATPPLPATPDRAPSPRAEQLAELQHDLGDAHVDAPAVTDPEALAQMLDAPQSPAASPVPEAVVSRGSSPAPVLPSQGAGRGASSRPHASTMRPRQLGMRRGGQR